MRFSHDAAGEIRANGRLVTPVGPRRWQLRGDVFDFSRPIMLRTIREGETIPYDWVKTVSQRDPTTYVGRFCVVDVQSCITITANGQGFRFRGPRWSGQPLEPAYRDVFVGAALPVSTEIVLKFQRDAAGRVDAIRLGESRAFNLLFKRIS